MTLSDLSMLHGKEYSLTSTIWLIVCCLAVEAILKNSQKQLWIEPWARERCAASIFAMLHAFQ